MKNKLMLAAVFGLAALSATACGGASQKSIDLNADKVTYDIDSRTGICYAAIGVAESDFFGMPEKYDLQFNPVACTDGVLKLVPQKKIDAMRTSGIQPVVK